MFKLSQLFSKNRLDHVAQHVYGEDPSYLTEKLHKLPALSRYTHFIWQSCINAGKVSAHTFPSRSPEATTVLRHALYEENEKLGNPLAIKDWHSLDYAELTQHEISLIAYRIRTSPMTGSMPLAPDSLVDYPTLLHDLFEHKYHKTHCTIDTLGSVSAVVGALWVLSHDFIPAPYPSWHIRVMLGLALIMPTLIAFLFGPGFYHTFWKRSKTTEACNRIVLEDVSDTWGEVFACKRLGDAILLSNIKAIMELAPDTILPWQTIQPKQAAQFCAAVLNHSTINVKVRAKAHALFYQDEPKEPSTTAPEIPAHFTSFIMSDPIPAHDTMDTHSTTAAQEVKVVNTLSRES